MEITQDMMRRAVRQQALSAREPFCPGREAPVSAFYDRVLRDLERHDEIAVVRELAHHGSGYASYVSAFLYKKDGTSTREFPAHIEKTGVLLYMSRLGPFAVFGASSITAAKDGKSSSSGFVAADNLGLLPEGDCLSFVDEVTGILAKHGLEMLSRE